jgi:hypothetical protein
MKARITIDIDQSGIFFTNDSGISLIARGNPVASRIDVIRLYR